MMMNEFSHFVFPQSKVGYKKYTKMQSRDHKHIKDWKKEIIYLERINSKYITI
jgi:hypothetical protein